MMNQALRYPETASLEQKILRGDFRPQVPEKWDAVVHFSPSQKPA
jgi:hypothetical protein